MSLGGGVRMGEADDLFARDPRSRGGVEESYNVFSRDKQSVAQLLASTTASNPSLAAATSAFSIFNSNMTSDVTETSPTSSTSKRSSSSDEEEEQPSHGRSPSKRVRKKRKPPLYEKKIDFRTTEQVVLPLKRTHKSKKLLWTAELQELFHQVVNRLGDKATTKQVFLEMNVAGLTKANVASHLQKYRMKQTEEAHRRQAEKNLIANLQMASQSYPLTYPSLEPTISIPSPVSFPPAGQLQFLHSLAPGNYPQHIFQGSISMPMPQQSLPSTSSASGFSGGFTPSGLSPRPGFTWPESQLAGSQLYGSSHLQTSMPSTAFGTGFEISQSGGFQSLPYDQTSQFPLQSFAPSQHPQIMGFAPAQHHTQRTSLETSQQPEQLLLPPPGSLQQQREHPSSHSSLLESQLPLPKWSWS